MVWRQVMDLLPNGNRLAPAHARGQAEMRENVISLSDSIPVRCRQPGGKAVPCSIIRRVLPRLQIRPSSVLPSPPARLSPPALLLSRSLLLAVLTIACGLSGAGCDETPHGTEGKAKRRMTRETWTLTHATTLTGFGWQLERT